MVRCFNTDCAYWDNSNCGVDEDALDFLTIDRDGSCANFEEKEEE